MKLNTLVGAGKKMPVPVSDDTDNFGVTPATITRNASVGPENAGCYAGVHASLGFGDKIRDIGRGSRSEIAFGFSDMTGILGKTMRMLGFCGLAVVLLTRPLMAGEHEVKAFGPVLEACYAAAPDPAARTACIGTMSQACMDRQEGGHSTLGMTFCLGAEADVWDRFLNAEYQATMAWAQTADEDEAVYFPEYAKRAENLLLAQRAWIGFRDAECGLAYAQWGAGSMRNIAGADCRMQMTAERALELRDMREMFE